MTYENYPTSPDTHCYWYWLAQQIRQTCAPHEQLRLRVQNPHFHPKHVPGFVRDAGLPAGERGDWRLRFNDGSGLHVQENADRSLSVHWDRVDPTPNMSARLRHGAQDAPGTFLLLSTLGGMLAGLLLGGKEGARVGAALGFGGGAIGVLATR